MIPKRTGYLGQFTSDPLVSQLVSGQWWYNTTERMWKFYNGEIISLFGGTFQRTVSIPSDQLGRPNINPPTVVDQDNLTLYSFTLNTDKMTYKFPIPSDYDSGPFLFKAVWTNDGGIDDNGRNVKWQLSYQVGSEGDVISGSHANSPKTVEDTYGSASGWVEHDTAQMSIAASDFVGKTCIYLQLMAVTPSGSVLTSEPHLLGLCYTYTAKRYVA